MFLRKKSKQQQKPQLQSQSPPYSKPLDTTPDVGSPTPLFAKFASLAGTNGSGTKPVVSAPITLAQKTQSGNGIGLGTEAARTTSVSKAITVDKPLPPPKSPPSQLSAASYLPPKETIASNGRRISTQTRVAAPATDSAPQNKADTAGSSRPPSTRKSSVPAKDLRRRESNANGYSYSGQSSVNVFNGNGQDTYGHEQTPSSYRATNSNNIPSSSPNRNNYPPSSFAPTPSTPPNGLPVSV
ncbi:hypothetical protein BDP27DRAFT_647317 [Rhodocollybia butyracea]|uniref:Uncharacterized protein n=1 Tax=Rhodocollybia butyracea TaxID=206335 RepID=A0A9P5PUC3_9AGAR|nr:hypothetical protein BDP27DRAFT_647317 [Rhodocollybia butyracea]